LHQPRPGCLDGSPGIPDDLIAAMATRHHEFATLIAAAIATVIAVIA
jgi:hypothetical protein